MFSTAPGSATVVYDHGQDQIVNFHAGDGATHDTIAISKLLAADYKPASLQVAQSGANAVVTLSANDSILLRASTLPA